MEPKNPFNQQPVPKIQSVEKKESLKFEPEYFNIELQFAKTISEKTGQPLEEVILNNTDFYRRFGLGKKYNPNKPRWQEYVKGIQEGKDLVALSYEFYTNPPIKEKKETDQKPNVQFGNFKYDIEGETVDLHFVNKGQDGINKIETFNKDLHDLFASIKENHPEATKVKARSWLLGTPIPARFLPPAFIDSLQIEKTNFKAGSRWGQFVDQFGKVKPKFRDAFLSRLQNINIENLHEAFPIQTYEGESDITEFYKFYQVQ